MGDYNLIQATIANVDKIYKIGGIKFLMTVQCHNNSATSLNWWMQVKLADGQRY